MSFPRYEKYKDSGVEWLGEVPEHWGSISLRWISRRFSGGTPDKNNPNYWVDGDVPWLNSGSVNDGFITEPSAYITQDALANSSAKWIPQFSLVMALAGQGKTKGMVAQLGFVATCNQSMAAIVPVKEIASRFLYWWLVTNYQNIRNMAGGDMRDGLNLEMVGNIRCPVCPLPEQSTIAAFLDHETGKIDALVAEQEKLIGLLKEKRQAVISHAVTKGLDPNARMKDSGVEWLGEVPEGWEVVRVKHTLKHIGSGGTPDTEQTLFWSDNEEGIPWVAIGDMSDRDFIESTAKRLTARGVTSKRLTVWPAGTLLFSMYASLGHTTELRVAAATNQAILALLPKKNVSQSFLKRWFEYLRPSLREHASSNTQDNLNAEKVRNLLAMLPPLPEQRTIAAFLDHETGKIDTLIEAAQRAIELVNHPTDKSGGLRTSSPG